jgi:3-oxoacyl-[acyl-carrier-protein] synthase I
MTRAFVRATALASALGLELGAAVERLAGEPVAPARDTPAGGTWPYFAIPVAGNDWLKRAELIAGSVAASVRREAALSSEQWACLPCIVGSSSNSVGAWDSGDWPALQPPVAFGEMIARWFDVHGPVLSVNTSCTSGLSALDMALGLIAAGRFNDALVVGVELSNRLTVAGFAGLQMLSGTTARPCDRDRDGLVLGEAIGALLVSRTKGDWRVASFASSFDATSMTGPEPSGATIADTMRTALAKASWSIEAVELIKLQAAGGPLIDLAEARAVHALFPSPPSVASLKGAIGHTLGASGPAELALLLACLSRGRIPPTWGFETPDAELGLSPSRGATTDVSRVLFNLFGFGGNLMSLALERIA